MMSLAEQAEARAVLVLADIRRCLEDVEDAAIGCHRWVSERAHTAVAGQSELLAWSDLDDMLAGLADQARDTCAVIEAMLR